MTRQALLIGINYRGTRSELRGCINDVEHMKEHLIKSGYEETEITVLTDDTPVKPTLKNMTKYLLKLVSCGADQLFFHYSGHGGSQRDYSGDEADGRDETLVPLDYQTAGMLVDDNIRGLLSFMKPNSKLTAVLDCCHSGTGMDLAYNYSERYTWNRIRKGNRVVRQRVFKTLMEKDNHYKDTPGQVIMLAGCKDPQYSADAYEEGKYQGALTFCILTALKDEECKTWGQLIKDVRALLKAHKYKQIAGLASGRPLSLDEEIKFC